MRSVMTFPSLSLGTLYVGWPALGIVDDRTRLHERERLPEGPAERCLCSQPTRRTPPIISRATKAKPPPRLTGSRRESILRPSIALRHNSGMGSSEYPA